MFRLVSRKNGFLIQQQEFEDFLETLKEIQKDTKARWADFWEIFPIDANHHFEASISNDEIIIDKIAGRYQGAQLQI